MQGRAAENAPARNENRTEDEYARGDGAVLIPTCFQVETIPALPRRATFRRSPPRKRRDEFSRTLARATWSNTTLVKRDPAAAIREMKRETGPDLIIFGSGAIVSLLTESGLVDEYQFVLNPLVLGGGRTMFEGLTQPLNLRLASARSFKNGNVLLTYEPARA